MMMGSANNNSVAAQDDFKGHSKKDMKNSKMNSDALTMYLFFLSACGLVAQMFDGIGLSTLPTLSVALQVLALGFLWSKVQRTRNAIGISAKSLQLQAMVHGLRLCSTTWLKGYIPADATGDWLYQAMDAVTLLLCLQLTYLVKITHRATYQVDLDTFDIKPVVLVCFFLAIVIHPDLNDRILFDAIWATSLYIDIVAMMPQLWLMSQGGSVESLTGHYVASVAFSRGCSFCFWYFGFVELAPADGGANVAGWAIIGAHVIQALIFCDFMYYYIKNWMQACGSLCNAEVVAKIASSSPTADTFNDVDEAPAAPALVNAVNAMNAVASDGMPSGDATISNTAIEV